MIRLMNKLRNKKGFTLVELIVVIAILGVLAGIAVPKVMGYVDNAKTNTDSANVRMLEGAATMWLAENEKPSTSEVWNGGEGTDDNKNWKQYIETWPQKSEGGNYTVTIDNEGNIEVN